MNTFDLIAGFLSATIMLIGLLYAAGETKNGIENLSAQIKLKAESERCAMLTDSFYSNSGTSLITTNTQCAATGKEVFAFGSGGSVGAELLFAAKSFSQKESAEIKVEVAKHYEE